MASREDRPQEIVDYLDRLLSFSKIKIKDSGKVSLIEKLEALKAELDENEASYISSLISLTQKIFTVPAIKDLDYGILNLKKESITASCRNLINQYLGEEKASTFNKYYKIRSAIAHNGKVPKDFDQSLFELDEIVSQILYRSVKNISDL